MLRNTLNTFITATLIMLLGVSSSAKAMVPANSRITSTSTLTVEGLDPLTATVTVTVGLQRSKPEIVLKAGTEEEPNPSLAKWIAGKRGGENTTTELTYKYTITTTANGPAKYTVEANLTEEYLDKSNLRYSKNVQSPISLGATAVLSVSVEDKMITVPSDGKFERDNHPTTVNGITAGDKVVINGMPEVFNVFKVDDSNGKTATITLKETPPGDLNPGDPIAEQATFTVTLDEVTLAENAPQGRATNDLTVTASQADFDEIATSGPQEFLVIKPREPKMKFYVRNIDEAANPVDAPDANKTEHKGNFYFETDLTEGEVVVKANPGDTLEYLVVVRAGNDGPLRGDEYQMPATALSDFLEYVPGQTYLNRGEQPLPGDEEGDWPSVFLQNGTYGDSVAIDSDQTAYITYQMTVMGGVGDSGERGEGERPAVASETYVGCLLVNSERVERDIHCKPDGTNWESIRTAVFEMADWPALDGVAVTDWHTACWKGKTGGSWVVGPNSLGDEWQRDARFTAGAGIRWEVHVGGDLTDWSNMDKSICVGD